LPNDDLFSYVKNAFSPARYAFEEGISALLKEASTTELFDIASFMQVSFRHCYSLGKEKQAPPYYVEALSRFLRFLFWLGILRFGVDKQGTPVAMGISKLGQSLLKGTKGARAFASSNELFVQHKNASSASEPQIEPVSDFSDLPRENIRYDNLIEPADLLMSEQPGKKSPVAKHQARPIPPHLGICQKEKNPLIRVNLEGKNLGK